MVLPCVTLIDLQVAMQRQFDFTSDLRRMAVVVETRSDGTATTDVFVKGAPESLLPICDPKSGEPLINNNSTC